MFENMAPVNLRLAFTLCVTTVSTPALAQHSDLEIQCRQEADSYAIPSEQLEEYLDGCMLARGGSLSSAPEQSASIEAQCRQEAKDYGVAPEQQAEYINGCILSLGGSLPPVPASGEVTPGAVPVDGGSQDRVRDSVDVQ